MSGVADERLMPSCTGNGAAIVEAMLSQLGLTVKDVETLATVPYPQLVQAYTKAAPAVAAAGGYVGGAPLMNDWFLGNPLQHGFRETAGEIPLMIGSVFGEFAFALAPFDKKTVSEAETKAAVAQVYGEHTEEMIAAFREAYPGKHPSDLLFLDRVMRVPSKKLAALHARCGRAGTYLYNFTLEFPMGDKIAWHCSDIPFFFHNTDKVEVCAIPGDAE